MKYGYFHQIKHFRVIKWLFIYLILSGVIAHLLMVTLFTLGVQSFFNRGTTFAKTLSANGKHISHNYPAIDFIGVSLSNFGTKLDKPDYFQGEFNAANWPSVGPKVLAHTELLPTGMLDKRVFVSNEIELLDALKNAQPDSAIVIKNGTYKIKKNRLPISKQPASEVKPIYLVAEQTGEVTLQLETSEGLYLNQPYWHIYGIVFKGTCASHGSCHHAMHVVGNGSNLHIAHNHFIDFSAAIKVNRLKGLYPDNGVIEYNHFYNTFVRSTRAPVTPINMDHGNNWRTSHNIIRDFLKNSGNRISYGAFYKGGAVGGEISNNLVICETGPSQGHTVTVGLSLGGGGMNIKDRRGNTEYETESVVVKNNIVMHCSDVALYVNKGKDSIVHNNTFYNTFGLDLRFPQTTGKVYNNLLNSKIRFRNEGSATLNDNVIASLDYWSGDNPMKMWFQRPSQGNFTYKGTLPFETENNTPAETPSRDFCSSEATTSTIGAVHIGSTCFR